MTGFKALPSAGLSGRRPRSHCQVTPPPTDGIEFAVGAGRNSEGPESGLEDSANSTGPRFSKISKFRLVHVGNHNFENFENHWAPAHLKVFKVSLSASAPGAATGDTASQGQHNLCDGSRVSACLHGPQAKGGKLGKGAVTTRGTVFKVLPPAH